MKSLKLKVGDTLIINRRIRGNPGFVTFSDEAWDVIKVNKKSIIIQNYPTYKLKKVKL